MGVGIAQIDWEKYPANPVIDLGDDGSWDDIHISHPSVLFDGNIYHLWCVGDNGSLRGIGYARSADGVAWEKYPGNPVLSDGLGDVWDGDFVSQPTVLYDGTQYRMWYAGYDGTDVKIGYAISDDGIEWDKDASNPVLDESGSWESIGVNSPTVVLDGNTYRMWYTGYDGANIRVGFSSLDLPESVARLTARVHANPATYEAAANGAEVTLDGSQSIGSDGNPITDDSAYEWDLNNDGDFSDAMVTHVYSFGEHTAALRVTDGDENSIDTINIKVEDTKPPLVKLLAPYGGETYQGGETIAILWQPAVDIVSLQNNSITLYYSVDGGDWLLIAENETNDGLYEWTTPTLNSDDVKVEIESIDTMGNIGSDTSAVEFTIDSQVPVVELTSPNGGEVLGGGSIFSVTWQPATDNFDLSGTPINLYYSIDSGTNWQLITEYEQNDGGFNWGILALDSANMLLRIQAVDRADNVGEDISDNIFEIDSTKPQPPMLL